jgi:hypothetical protein
LGGFSIEQNINAIKRVGITSGRQRSFEKADWEFIDKFAKRAGILPEEAAKLFGTISFQNKRFSGNDVQSAILAATGIGQSLSFGANELMTAPKVMAASTLLGGGLGNIRTSMTLAGLLKPQFGSLEQAGTAEEALIREMKNNAGALGIKLDPITGNFIDFKSALGTIVNTPFSTLKGISPGLVGREAGPAIAALKTQAESGTGKNLNEKLQSLITEYEKQAVSMSDFEKENNDATDATERLKVSTNRVQVIMQKNLEQSLIDLAGGSEYLADYINQNQDSIRNLLNEFVKDLAFLVLVVKNLSEIMLKAGEIALDTMIDKLPGGALIRGALKMGAGESLRDWISSPNKFDDQIDKGLKSLITGPGFFGSVVTKTITPSQEQINNLASELHNYRTGTVGGMPTEEEQEEAQATSQGMNSNNFEQLLRSSPTVIAIAQSLASIDKKTKPQLLPVPYRNPGDP